jgi:ubiquinone/menaquinone biosynthesis C-methylase UbiE
MTSTATQGKRIIGTKLIGTDEAYRHWAPTYDSTANPLLALEQRIAPLAKEMFQGKDVVDLGCGTGRWLSRIEACVPQSLTGVDSSEAMLRQAAQRCLPATRLKQADCAATGLPGQSADCIVASFVVSYVTDLQAFASEAARLLRPNGSIFVSDVHPHGRSYGWRRTVKIAAQSFEIATEEYTLQQLIAAMRGEGFLLTELIEPCFGPQEREIFRRAGKSAAYNDVEAKPVIYWAHFTSASE